MCYQYPGTTIMNLSLVDLCYLFGFLYHIVCRSLGFSPSNNILVRQSTSVIKVNGQMPSEEFKSSLGLLCIS